MKTLLAAIAAFILLGALAGCAGAGGNSGETPLHMLERMQYLD